MQPLEDMTASCSETPATGPFSLNDEAAYQAWRARKLAAVPDDVEALRVPLADPARLDESEKAALQAALRRANVALYRLADPDAAGKDTVRQLGRQLGLERLDDNLCADEDSITSLKVIPGGRQQGYIPYSNLRLSWHTDGYYNAPQHRIRAMILHCVRPAAAGGENLLLDHELCYLHLRDTNPEYIRALMHPQAMTIPPNVENGVELRGALSGPVFSVDPDSGALHMRYTARTRSIEWRDDPVTLAARDAIRDFLAGDSPFLLRYRLRAGEGIISNNALHARTAFEDAPQSGQTRLLYRARYYDRVAAT